MAKESKNYAKWKKYHDAGWLSDAKIRNLVGKPLGLTQDEADEIIKGEKKDEN